MEPVRPRFVIEASEAESIASQSGLTVLQLLPTLVKSAQSVARTPISKFDVGAVGLGPSGRIFFGGNLEFPGLPLNQSVHAEQFLLTNLFLNAEPSLLNVAVSAAPCGHCRQFLQELRHAPSLGILITDDSNSDDNSNNDKGSKHGNVSDKSFEPLSHLLPHRFGPDDLLDKDVPLLLERRHNNLSFPDRHKNDKSVTHNGNITDRYEDLKREALDAANRSHAPYSNCPSGAALMDCEGNLYSGSYMESAAYNPSMGPVQAALVAYVIGGGGDGGYERIVAAALVEKEGGMVRQESAAKLLLQVISPECELRVFPCVTNS